MNVIRHIRTQIFEMPNQAAFAKAIGTTQASVSRLESGSEISLSHMKAIKEAAAALGKDFDERLFFEYVEQAEEPVVDEPASQAAE